MSLDSLPSAWFGLTLTGAPIDGHDDGVNLGVHPGNSDNLAFGIYSNTWNWADSGIFEGDYFLEQATQVKNIWVPYGA